MDYKTRWNANRKPGKSLSPQKQADIEQKYAQPLGSWTQTRTAQTWMQTC